MRFVLMYHRVCPRTRETEPWFARGTAVTPAAFAAQMSWVRAHYAVVPLGELLESPSSSPMVSLTFDDGYREIREAVGGLPATCFASAVPVLDRGFLWFDAWYSVVATGPSAEALGLLSDWGAPPGPDWIRGPTRQWLAALPASDRTDRLNRLMSATGASPPGYVDVEDLVEMASGSWTIGGHGAGHLRLTDVDQEAMSTEVARSIDVLSAAGTSAHAFAYPDGAHDDRVARCVRDAGFKYGLTVASGAIDASTSPFHVPRLFCRGEGPVPHPDLERRR